MRTENVTYPESGSELATPCPSVGSTGQEDPSIGLLGATFGTNNMGVNALTVGAIKTISHRWPNARVFLLDYAKAPTRYNVRVRPGRMEVPLVNIRFSRAVFLPNHILMLIGLAVLCRLIPVKAFRNWVARENPCLSAIDGASFVASVAVGDSFSHLYGLTTFF